MLTMGGKEDIVSFLVLEDVLSVFPVTISVGDGFAVYSFYRLGYILLFLLWSGLLS